MGSPVVFEVLTTKSLHVVHHLNVTLSGNEDT